MHVLEGKSQHTWIEVGFFQKQFTEQLPIRLVNYSTNSSPDIFLVRIEHALAGDAICKHENHGNEYEEPKVTQLRTKT